MATNGEQENNTRKGLKGFPLNTYIISEMATTTNTQEIKARLHEDIELNNLFLDMFDEPMTELENQICCLYDADYRGKCPIYDQPRSRFITQAEKVRVLVKYWKKIELIQSFINCELYSNYFKFYKDLSDDDYNILAIKYIVKNNLL
jgi:hypothetical protein